MAGFNRNAFCPLFSVVARLKIPDAKPERCIGKACAWYTLFASGEGKCSIFSINGIEYTGRKMLEISQTLEDAPNSEIGPDEDVPF